MGDFKKERAYLEYHPLAYLNLLRTPSQMFSKCSECRF